MFRSAARLVSLKRVYRASNCTLVKSSYSTSSSGSRHFSSTNPSYNTDKENASASVDPFLKNLGCINHVAIATKDAKKSSDFWRNIMGATRVSEKVPQPEHGVYTVFIELGQTKIELLEPIDEKSPISGFLQKNPTGGIHHICINVSDLALAIQKTKDNNIRSLGQVKIGAHGLPVIFLHPKDCNGVLIELEEHK
ncbi:hypothetical protein BB559_000909 [Furculomyces boomerangus]|uniref:Methylmalonyl-CoA epimerase, mitochondrial n=2 Tax=Harpellales TaxID=61421 RepID=A0A2T9Z3L2_9FUNG|nr:hypothetical protein BB559_000909 [Furculomyces boomerangus]PVZ96799.1 hypothetical protein BB558_007282 [Smittium angustum]PVZ98321.1 hypothetical protein BB558_005688 [Smittium angustum]